MREGRGNVKEHVLVPNAAKWPLTVVMHLNGFYVLQMGGERKELGSIHGVDGDASEVGEAQAYEVTDAVCSPPILNC